MSKGMVVVPQIKPFAVEQWMDKYQPAAKYDLGETCVSSISIDDLIALDGADKNTSILDTSTKLTYGTIRGSEKLRSNLSKAYSRSAEDANVKPETDILVTSGAIAANLIVFYALIGKGDHVICHYPTYQQLYELPASLGAEVSFWRSKGDEDWRLDVGELRRLIQPNTKMIVINNPQNPTGAIVPFDTIQAIIDLAREHDLFIHSDEVYRPLFHSMFDNKDIPPSLLTEGYNKCTVSGSFSKAYSLAGIRVGWIASPSKEIIDACMQVRDYTIISVSQLDDAVAAFALEEKPSKALLGRNWRLARTNLEILTRFIESRDDCSWVYPQAGTTAFIRFYRGGSPVDDEDMCRKLHETHGVLICPGSTCFGQGQDFRGYVRIGYCCETEVLKAGLKAFGEFLEDYR